MCVCVCVHVYNCVCGLCMCVQMLQCRRKGGMYRHVYVHLVFGRSNTRIQPPSLLCVLFPIICMRRCVPMSLKMSQNVRSHTPTRAPTHTQLLTDTYPGNTPTHPPTHTYTNTHPPHTPRVRLRIVANWSHNVGRAG